jgi:lipopolysaccharide/colanic/teichoic acid biosynthesis glycosyltransferase
MSEVISTPDDIRTIRDGRRRRPTPSRSHSRPLERADTDAPSPTPSATGALAKRALDIVGAAVLLVVLSPVLIPVALAVRLTSRGPAIFRQQRVGKDEIPFTCLKFRTMEVGNDDGEHRTYVTRLLTEEEPPEGGDPGVYKLTHDPRITPVGRWLRTSSLDELPQLVNVLRGEMSLVGPRPSLPWEVELFEPRFRARSSVPPGITGLWQVSGRSRLSYREALELDLEYVRTHSLRTDLSILARTVLVVARGDGSG